MNIRKFLQKIGQTGVDNIPVEEDIVSLPEVNTPEVNNDIVNTAPSMPQMEGPNLQEIQTNLSPWTPTRGPNNGKTFYYLQVLNVPEGIGIEDFLTNNGYKFNKKFGSYSKQVNPINYSDIEAEFNNISSTFSIEINHNAIDLMKNIVGENRDDSVRDAELSESDSIQKIKFSDKDDKEKLQIAEDIVKKKLEELADDANGEKAKAFLDQFLNLNNKFYKYSFLNSFLAAIQNIKKDPETGEYHSRSGTVSSSGAWEKKFGRKVKPEEIENGMDIFVPTGGKKNVTEYAIKSASFVLKSFIQQKGDLDLSQGDSVLLSWLRLRVAKSKKDWKPGKIYNSTLYYIQSAIGKLKHQDKPLFVSDVLNYVEGKIGVGDTVNMPIRFTMKPIYDMDQTEVIPGQEDKDPKAEMEKVEQMWMGDNNTESEQSKSLVDLAIRAASSGKIWKGKNVSVSLDKSTGGAGGWSRGQEIQISDRVQGERQLFIILHELAHSVLHFGKNRTEFSKQEKEIDAEAVAYVIMNHYGFDSQSHAANYIAGFSQNKDLIMNRFRPVLEAANAIVGGIENQKMEDYGNVRSSGNWYSRIKTSGRTSSFFLKEILSFVDPMERLLKTSHYSEPEGKGEGYGGEGQFQQREISERVDENKDLIEKIKAAYIEGIKTRKWDRFNALYKNLTNNQDPKKNYAKKTFDAWLLSPATYKVRLPKTRNSY